MRLNFFNVVAQKMRFWKTAKEPSFTGESEKFEQDLHPPPLHEFEQNCKTKPPFTSLLVEFNQNSYL